MEPRISLITLGVRDLAASKAFYERLGLAASPKSSDGIVFIQLGALALALFPRADLATDAGMPPEGMGFRAVTLAHNVRDKADVAALLDVARRAGAKITQEAHDVFWGGHNGYFADPDGHLWEVAWNPFTPLGADGSFVL